MRHSVNNLIYKYLYVSPATAFFKTKFTNDFIARKISLG